MRHLTESELLDVAEGTGSAASAGHLVECDACRREVGELQTVMAAAAAVEVPEPSPLFWEHLSARVHAGVSAEAGHSTLGWLPRWVPVGVLAPVGAVAMLALVAALVWGPTRESSTSAPDTAVTSTMAADEMAAVGDDASFALLAALSAELDWEAANEAGLVPPGDVVDDLVSSLSGGERGELHRLLQEALGPSGV